jgi:hypothetical protein
VPDTSHRESFFRSCLRHLRDRPARRRCLQIALVVGTILAVINQGDVIVAGDVTPLVAAKLALDYLVPFAVSSLGFISARRASSA